MIRKYGKSIDQRSISNRDIQKIKGLIDTYELWNEKSLTQFDSGLEYDCRICHCKDIVDFVVIHAFHYAVCKKCGSVILLNLPDVKRLYTSENSAMADNFLDEKIFQKRTENIALPKVRFVLDLLPTISIPPPPHDNKLWCDIGCGVGEVLLSIDLIKSTGNRKIDGVGIESDPREIRFARSHGLSIYEGFLDAKAPKELLEIISKADVVSMFNVLEHIERPDETINLLANTMRCGSFLVIDVPRHPSLASFVNLISPQFTYRHIVPPIHLQVFSEKAIEFLKGDSFELVATWGFGQGFTDILTSSMLLSGVQEISLYNSLMNIANDVQKTIDEKGYSDAMIYVMRKI